MTKRKSTTLTFSIVRAYTDMTSFTVKSVRIITNVLIRPNKGKAEGRELPFARLPLRRFATSHPQKPRPIKASRVFNLFRLALVKLRLVAPFPSRVKAPSIIATLLSLGLFLDTGAETTAPAQSDNPLLFSCAILCIVI